MEEEEEEENAGSSRYVCEGLDGDGMSSGRRVRDKVSGVSMALCMRILRARGRGGWPRKPIRTPTWTSIHVGGRGGMHSTRLRKGIGNGSDGG